MAAANHEPQAFRHELGARHHESRDRHVGEVIDEMVEFFSGKSGQDAL